MNLVLDNKSEVNINKSKRILKKSKNIPTINLTDDKGRIGYSIVNIKLGSRTFKCIIKSCNISSVESSYRALSLNIKLDIDTLEEI